ncbi:MAG: hypothetical protein U0V75_15675 [Ferruginibacter sp.]
MSLKRTPIIFLVLFLFLCKFSAIAQADSMSNVELREFSAKLSSNFWPSNTEIGKVRTEMYFVLLHVKDSAINSFEIFYSVDTILKEYLTNYLEGVSKNQRFKFVSNLDYVIPIVVKNVAQESSKPIINTDYDNLFWRTKTPKRLNTVNDIFSFPQFIYRTNKPLSGRESLAPQKMDNQ